MSAQIKFFQALPHPFGHEVALRWGFTEPLESNQKLYIFKRSEEEVKDTEIKSYFSKKKAKEKIDMQLEFSGLMVFYSITNEDDSIWDVDLRSDYTYYYKAVIVDDKFKVGKIVALEAKPIDFDAELTAPPTKDYVIEGMKKINIAVAKQLKADIIVYRDFEQKADDTAFIVVRRASGDIAYKTWEDSFGEYGAEVQQGTVDSDVIQVSWFVQNDSRARDKLTDLYRATRPKLLRYLRKKDEAILDASITIIGDGERREADDRHLLYGSMLINILLQSKIKYNQSNLFKAIDYELGFNTK